MNPRLRATCGSNALRARTVILGVLLLTGLAESRAQTGPGQALQFDGAASQVQVAAKPALTPAQFTFEAWVNPQKQDCNTIVSRGDGGNGAATDYIFQVGYNGSTCGAQMRIALFVGGGWFSSTNEVPLGAWTHVAVSFDGSALRFYMNGVPDAVTAQTNAPYQSGFPLYIGRQGTVCNCNFFKGLIDEVRIWSIPRTPAQLSAGMSQALSGSEPGLVAYYRFDEGNGATAGNSAATGSDYNGTLTNGPVWALSGARFVPDLLTGAVGGITTNSAVLNGTVNPGNLPTSAWFDYGLTTNYGSSTPSVALSGTNANLAVTAIVNGLTAGQTYQYRIVATNSTGTNFGLPQTFQTATIPILLLSPNISTGGYFGFTLSGPAGYNYNIESSAGLSNWATLSTLSNATGLVPFMDSNTPALLPRFYRAKLLPPTVPGIPQNVFLTPGAAKMTVSWTAPASNGGSPIDAYFIQVFRNATLAGTYQTASLSTTISNLLTVNYPSGAVGQSYSFYLTAHNAIGFSDAVSRSGTPRVSYVADNIYGIWPAKSCVGCHSTGGGIIPVLDTGSASYTSAKNEGSLIYQVPANQAPGHHVGFSILISTTSFEYSALHQWVSDGQLQ